MSRLPPDAYAELDDRLGPVDAELARRYPGEAPGRQPVHTVYVPAHRYHPALVEEWGAAALAALADHPPLPFDVALRERVIAKLAREPIEDLRIDFEDGYGVRDDAHEDGAARSAAASLPATPFVGIRVKSLEGPTRRRAVRTLDVFLDALDRPPPDGFVVTLPKVSAVEQVEAMAVLCGRLEKAYGLSRLPFEIQIETPQAVLTVARLIDAADGRCAGLHFGTYDYTAALGIGAAQQSLDHPAADHAKAVMQVAAAGTGVRLSDGSSNVLPVGTGSPQDSSTVHAAWALHARLVRRSLERGFYQGWDLHPAQLPTRYGATYAFFADGLATLDTALGNALDEPATARAREAFLRRGRECGAFAGGDQP